MLSTQSKKARSKSKGSFGEIVKAFFNAAMTSVIVFAALVIATVWIVPLFIGVKPVTVLSGSMEPTFSAGDVIWVSTDKENVAIGDIVVFHPEAYDSTLVTHRVISANTGSEKVYRTQGDANGVADDPIVEGQIVGTVKPPLSYIGLESNVIAFPKVGYLQQHLFIVGIVIVGLSILLWIVSALTSKLNKKETAENE